MSERPSARRPFLAAIAAVVALGLLFVQAPAIADEVEDATKTAKKAADGAVKTAAEEPPEVPSTPTSDDDSPGHETQNPDPPDHARASLIEVHAGGEEILVVGETESRIEDDGRARGHASLFRFIGFEPFRAESDSRGTEEQSAGPLAPFCDPIGPLLCFGLGLAHSESHESGQSSSSNSSVLFFELCVLPGGILAAQVNGCDGLLVEIGLAESDISRNHQTGRTRAEAFSGLVADLCFGGIDSIGGCGGFIVAGSEANAPSDSTPGTAERFSCLGFIEDIEDEECPFGEPFAIGFIPGLEIGGCTESLFCLFFNQGESFIFLGGAAARQEAFHFAIVPSEEFSLDIHLATAEVLARNFGVAPEEEQAPEVVEAPALAVTGGDIWFLLLAAASLLGLGGMTLMTRRLLRAGTPA